MKSLDFFIAPPSLAQIANYRTKDFAATLLVVNRDQLKKSPKDLGPPWERAFKPLPKELADSAKSVMRARKFKAKNHEFVMYDLTPNHRIVVVLTSGRSLPFDLLTAARKAFAPLLEIKPKNLALIMLGAGQENARTTHQLQVKVGAFVSAWAAGVFKMPKYLGADPTKKKKSDLKPDSDPALSLAIFLPEKPSKTLAQTVAHAADLTGATNLVRRLSLMSGNDLTPSRYVALALDLAGKCKLKSTFHSLDDLEKMGAGAFAAVSLASDDRGGGILKISYGPKGGAGTKPKHLVLAGKGICFDTGGANLKTGGHMFGMNGDMAGSAVALATVLLAAKEQWPLRVTALLGITDNMIGPKGFRPNDIVKTLNGKTVEVIDTDAEGRMILADTLHLASEEAPDLLLDFATLTGSCIRALGTSYSGIFGHSNKLYSLAIRAGTRCGERVWPFPTDIDAATALKSEVADIKQCRVSGGPDHIEAAFFLSQFVPKQIPWLHVDLAATENEGGLAHVPTKVTGFGVRFAAEMADLLLNDDLN